MMLLYRQMHSSFFVYFLVPVFCALHSSGILANVLHFTLMYSISLSPNILMQVKCSSDPSEASGFVRVNKLLTFIPLLFIILRIWSLVQYIYTICITKRYPTGCVPPGLKAGYLTFGIMQVKSVSTYWRSDNY